MTEGASSEPPTTSVPTSASTSAEAQAPASPQPAPTTKTGIAFGGLIAGAIVLILLLVFILENTESVKISYFGAGGHLPLGVALLLAAIGGALVTGIVGAARIMQLRRHVRRRSRR
ncbi:MAG: DUF1049 domain-containing protein [Solirubrobacterales bacterium]|nr:DUF1049 domain-containing protein [Solirubrobacterales bacterium]